jgi:hypothetical protein
MAQIKDFVVKQGLVAEGTAQSLGTNTGALIVAGGAGIGGNINIGGKIRRDGNVGQGRDHNLGAALSLRDGTFTDELISGRTAWGIVNYFGSSVLDTISEDATYTNAASVFIKGAPQSGDNLTIEKSWSLYITSGTVFIGESSGNTTTSQGQALQIAGGLSVGAGMYATGGGSLFGPWTLNSSEIVTRANQNVGLAEFPDGIRITTSTQSISTTTGALIVDLGGGAGIGGNVYVGGYLAVLTTGTFLSTENAISTSTGALRIAGGLGVGADLYAQNGFFNSGSANTASVANNSLQIINGGGLGVEGSARIEGLVYLTDNTNSLGTGSGALVVTGGASIGRHLTVKTVTITDDSAATGFATAPLTVVGGVGISKNLIIGDNSSSTSTTATNALQVAGGGHFGGDLSVNGSAVIRGDLYLLGTGTQVVINSTNTYIVDPVIEIGGGIDGSMLTIPDVYDKGLLIHYQNEVSTVTDYRAFFGLENDSENFIFKQNILPGVGGEDPFGNYYNSGTWSTIEAGSLILHDNTVSVDPLTGALVVAGGIGVSENSYFANTVTVVSEAFNLTNIIDNAFQVPNGGIGAKYLFIEGEGWIGDAQILTTGTVNNNIGGIFTNTFQFVNLTESDSTTTGAVTVSGGVGIGGNLNIGGNQTLAGTLEIFDDTQSVSTDSGAIVVAGGVGIGKNLNVGELVRFISTESSTTTDTGALVVTGGVGIGENLNVAGTATIAQSLEVARIIVTDTDDSEDRNTGTVTIAGSLGVDKTINSARLFTDLARVKDPINSTSTDTGALIVTGGVGIGSDTHVGGKVKIYSTDTAINETTAALVVDGGIGVAKDLFVSGTIIRSGTVTKTLLNNLGAGLVLSSSTYVDSVSTGTTNGVVAIHSIGRPTIAGTFNPVWNDAATVYIDNSPLFTGDADASNKWSLFVANGQVKINTSSINNGTTNTGALQVVGGVGIGGNLTVGGTEGIYSKSIRLDGNQIKSSAITGKTDEFAVEIDSYNGANFTSAKYMVQVVDLGVPNKFHVVELMVTYDGAGSTDGVYISQYGIITNTGELGTFDVVYNGGSISVVFTPNYDPVNMSIRTIRMAIIT